MASLTSNPMEEMLEEEEYQTSDNNKNISSAGGYRRSWSNPGPEPDMNRPNTLRLCSGNNSVRYCVCVPVHLSNDMMERMNDI